MLPHKALLLWASALLLACSLGACTGGNAGNDGRSGSHVLKVVAAENFYGDIVSQLGSKHVTVQSILSDPNVDPHEYESNVKDAKAIQDADLIVKNGAGYDTWMDKLLSASPNAQRIVLTSADIVPHKLPDNPHVWYGLDNIAPLAQSITDALKKLDSTDKASFDDNLTTFKQSLAPLQQKVNDLKAKYQGTPVGLTETIYLYQTAPIGLNVLTPLAFEKAISEGNDPPADTVVETNAQISQKQIKLLIYNEQTVTPVTTNLQNAATQQNIPIVPVTETMPTGKSYQSWMLGQLDALQQGLGD